MVERELKHDRILINLRNDLAKRFSLDKANEYMKKFPEGRICSNINDALEAYKVKKTIEALKDKITDKDKYKADQAKLSKSYSIYMNKITDENIVEEYGRVNCRYFDDFWDIFEQRKLYERISSESINKILSIENGNALIYILQHKKTVNQYNPFLYQYMLTYSKSAEILINKFMVKDSGGKQEIYLPPALEQQEYKKILQNYIESDKAKEIFLEIFFREKGPQKLSLEDLRYSCKKKLDDLKEKNANCYFIQNPLIIVGSKPQKELICCYEPTPGIIQVDYDSEWLKIYTDFPSIFKNFPNVFQMVDYMGRMTFVKNTIDEIESKHFNSLQGKNDYAMGPYQSLRFQRVLLSFYTYTKLLKEKQIRLEDAFVWFFEEYLPQNFHNAQGFSFNISSENNSDLDLTKLLFTEIDGIKKQYSSYAKLKRVDRDYLQTISKPVAYGQILSILKNKYLYVKSKELKDALLWIFSDQSELKAIVRGVGEAQEFIQEDSFFSLVTKHEIYEKDFNENPRELIYTLRDKGIVQIEKDGRIALNKSKCAILNQLYRFKVLNAYYLKNDPRASGYLEELVKKGDVEYRDTLFSEPESDFLNYILNKSQYRDGLDLRNRYIHGSYPTDKKVQHRDYMIALLVVVSIILKINEEFCLKYLEGNGKK